MHESTSQPVRVGAVSIGCQLLHARGRNGLRQWLPWPNQRLKRTRQLVGALKICGVLRCSEVLQLVRLASRYPGCAKHSEAASEWWGSCRTLTRKCWPRGCRPLIFAVPGDCVVGNRARGSAPRLAHAPSHSAISNSTWSYRAVYYRRNAQDFFDG